MIYLASPYTHEDPLEMERRYLANISALRFLMVKETEIVYSPIVYWHNVAKMLNLPHGFEHWEDYDRQMLRLASKVIVLRIGGWESSKGVKAEIEIAGELGIMVEYL